MLWTASRVADSVLAFRPRKRTRASDKREIARVDRLLNPLQSCGYCTNIGTRCSHCELGD